MTVREHHKGWLMSLVNWVCKGDAITSTLSRSTASSSTIPADCGSLHHYDEYWFLLLLLCGVTPLKLLVRLVGFGPLVAVFIKCVCVCLCPDTVVKWLAFWLRELRRAPLGFATEPPPPIVSPPLGHFSTDKPAAVLWWMSSRRCVTKISELSFPSFLFLLHCAAAVTLGIGLGLDWGVTWI